MQGAGVLLQLAPIGPLADGLLHEELGAVRLWEEDALSWIGQYGTRIAMVATSNRYGCDAALMASLPNLRAISSWGVGFETIDTCAALARSIQVSDTPDVLDDCVADLAWDLLIAAARRIGVADRYVRDGQWQRLGEFPLATRVSGKRLGILGLGRIGSAIARRGEGFSMQVRYHGRAPKAVPYSFEPSLEALADWSDFLVIACGGGPETQHLVSARVLQALGPGGILVNIGRGAVVDQAALIRALEEGAIGGAGLDVLEGEPGAPVALRVLENVVMTPHIGSATTETRAAMERLVVDNLKAFLRTGRVLTPVCP
ncbi:2-hydroxyacid dehydrogenase [Roseomonas sp. GCM10028921]